MSKPENLTCRKCSAKILIDRVFSTIDHLELYCLRCGKREIYHHTDKFDERARWIMQLEIARAKRIGSPL